jgi:putative component of toxin-antitoxin plasmid stabilization module
MGQRGAYQEKREAQLNEWGAKLQGLKAKAERAKADAKIEYQQQLKDLEAKQAAAREKLEHLKKAGEGAWEDLRAGVESAWGEVKQAMDKALATLEK